MHSLPGQNACSSLRILPHRMFFMRETAESWTLKVQKKKKRSAILLTVPSDGAEEREMRLISMKNMKIESLQYGETWRGFSCGPVGGEPVAEAEILDLDSGKRMYFSVAVSDSILNYMEADKSLFEMLTDDPMDHEDDWEYLNDHNTCGFEGIDEFLDSYDELAEEDPTQAWILRLLAYLTVADEDEADEMIRRAVGKAPGSFDIPLKRTEDEYWEEEET